MTIHCGRGSIGKGGALSARQVSARTAPRAARPRSFRSAGLLAVAPPAAAAQAAVTRVSSNAGAAAHRRPKELLALAALALGLALPGAAHAQTNADPVGKVLISCRDRSGGTLTHPCNPEVDQWVSANAQHVIDTDGMDEIAGVDLPKKFDYRWYRLKDGARTLLQTDTGSGQSHYTVTNADLGATLTATASYTDLNGTNETVLGEEVGPVVARTVGPSVAIEVDEAQPNVERREGRVHPVVRGPFEVTFVFEQPVDDFAIEDIGADDIRGAEHDGLVSQFYRVNSQRYTAQVSPRKVSRALVPNGQRSLALFVEADRATTTDGRGNTLGLTHVLVDMWKEQGPELSVFDAGTVYEQPGATLDFRVTLDPESNEVVTVDYLAWGNHNGAQVGVDFEKTEGTLTFERGETEKTVSVPIIDDSVDEMPEFVNLGIHDADGAYIENPQASGMITNSELVARFLDVPAAHDGSGAFAFRVEFSDEIAPLGGESFTVAGGPHFRSGGRPRATACGR